MLTLQKPIATGRELEPVTFDPFLCHVDMPLAAVFYPLGFPLELTTTSADVLEAAEESWGAFEQRFETKPLQIRVGVLEGESTECPAGPVFRAHRNLTIGIADQGNFCVNDVVNGFSFAWLTTAATSHRSYLRYQFLEAAALAHIANRHTTPLHAACVELHGHGFLLCGDSGAGKSSLAFACAHAGWNFITDDASFLLNARSDRQVVGNCHQMRLRPSAAELFPEVAGKPLTPRAGVGPSIELSTADLPDITRASSSNIDYIVFLNRRDANVQELIPHSRESARKYFCERLFELEELRKVQIASVERLLATEVLELRYRDLDWAVDRLAQLASENR